VSSGGAAHVGVAHGGGAAVGLSTTIVAQSVGLAAMPAVVAVDISLGRRLRTAAERQRSGQEWQGTWEARDRLHLCAGARQGALAVPVCCSASRYTARARKGWVRAGERSERATRLSRLEAARQRLDVVQVGQNAVGARAGPGQ
jgi:hypothetical protein